jgi:phytoene dehydrogenase-like protein
MEKRGTEMNRYDYIIIGAGMGGLSAANFLAKFSKRVLVLEKHSIPGGFCTSFKRKETQFDCGIDGLCELKPNETIPQFFKFWGTSIESKKHNQNTACYIDAAVYSFKADHLKEDFLNHFPNDKKDIEKIFTINEGIMKEMFSGGAPKPPYEMSLFQLLQFGIRNMMKKPLLMKYGMKNFSSTIRKLSKNNILAAIMLSKAAVTNKMVYFAYAYRWWAMNNSYYPEGGMQSIPDKAVEIFKQHNGTFLLNTEVAKIITEAGKAIGVRTKQGDEYFAERIISNISPSFTYSLLPDDCIEKSKMMQKIQNKKIGRAHV